MKRSLSPSPAKASAALVMDVIPQMMDVIRLAMRRGAGEHLSVPQFRCLRFVASRPGCTIGEVARFLGVTMPTASTMVDRLVRADLLAPQLDAGDRRRSPVGATAFGLAQLAQIQQAGQVELETALAGCTEDELATLQTGLALLSRTFRPGTNPP